MPRFLYTKERLEFLQQGYQAMLVPELTRAFNLRFQVEKTPGEIKSTLKNHKITCGRKKGADIWRSKLFTADQAQWLRDNYVNLAMVDLTAAFNQLFAAVKTVSQIKAYIKNNQITCGRTGQFEAGLIPWNTGKKGYMGPNVTSFKKGDRPANLTRLWSERICPKDGFIQIKVPEFNPYTGFPTRYKCKHVWLWECHHGPVPKGKVVAFIDGDKLNVVIENLMTVTRGELLVLNLHNYKNTPAELKPSVLALAKLEAKAGVRSRPGRGRVTL